MDYNKIGGLICRLRKEKNLTQRELADLIGVSDKAVSKWERALGCPDVGLLSDLSEVLGVRIEDILCGEAEVNEAIGGNMKKLKFYVCKQCGNVLTATGEASISCCGKKIEGLEATKADEIHLLKIENIEDELYVSSEHEMTKEHYISFVAFVTGDKVFISKQYPEWNMQFRFHRFGHGKLYSYCTEHGLSYQLL